eukprot:15445440-Alexandrium_andersonii.AAC.1
MSFQPDPSTLLTDVNPTKHQTMPISEHIRGQCGTRMSMEQNKNNTPELQAQSGDQDKAGRR